MLKSKFKVHTQNVSETKVAAELILRVAISKLRGYTGTTWSTDIIYFEKHRVQTEHLPT